MEISELKAVIREETGKGPARRLRNQGIVPAVFYGRGSKTMSMSINAADLRNLMKKKEENILIKLIIEDQGKKLEKLSVIKELQMEPISRRFFHADFYEIRMDQAIEWDIPLHFQGTAIGVKNGGELLHQKREIKVSCLPTQVPEFFSIDLSKLDIGHSLKVRDIEVGEGITVVDTPDAVVVSIVSARVEAAPAAEEAVEGEEPKAPEVIKQKASE
jgi:large subunit ribosomal protein L25